MGMASNPWVISVFSGIFNTVLVKVFAALVFSRAGRHEYMHGIDIANREVLQSVRLAISAALGSQARVGLELDRIEINRAATATRYAVDSRDLLNVADLAKTIYKEIMDSHYIPSIQKEAYYDRLRALIDGGGSGSGQGGLGQAVVEANRRIAVTLGFVAGLTTVAAGVVTILDASDGELASLNFLVVALLALLPFVVVLTFMEIIRKAREGLARQR